MIKRPTADKAKAGGFFSLFFSDDNKLVTKPSQSPRGSGSVGIEMKEGGLGDEHHEPSTKNLKPGLLDMRKKKGRVERPTKRTTISINHNEKEKASDFEKFKRYFSLLCTLWTRRLKFASGSVSVLMTSYIANFIMLLLCCFVRSQVSGDFLIPYDLWKVADPGQMGMQAVGLLLPSKAMYNATVNVGFAPCTLDTNGDPVSGDPVGDFITTYKANYPSAYVSPIDQWNIQCFEDEDALEDHYVQNPSNANFGAFIIKDPTSLTGTGKEVEYTLRQNASSFSAVDTVYGGPHNTDKNLFMYLATFELQMQLHFESSVINHKLGLSSVDGNIIGTMDLKQAPTTGHYDYQGKESNFLSMAPMYLMMMLSSIVCEMLQECLMEKEEKYKATLSTSGLPDWAYWAAWGTYMLRQMTLPLILMFLASAGYIFSSSNPGVLFIFFFFTTTAFVSLTLSISSFLFTASFGAIMGTMLVWIFSIPGFILDDPEIAVEVKYLVLLLPPCNFAYSLKNFAHAELPKYEESDVGISFGHFFTAPPGEVSLGGCLLFLIFDTGLYLCIAWYLEKVVPDQWGKCLPPSFIFSKEYWTGELTDEQKQKEEMATALARVSMQFNSAPGGGEEELTHDGKVKEVGLDVRHLRKVYGEDPVEAVEKEENIHYRIGHDYCKSDALVESRMEMNKLVKSGGFEAMIYFFIALNMVAIVMDNERFHNNDEDAIVILDLSNYVFCLVFSFEMFYKFYGMSVENYFKDYFNCFDFLLVLSSWVEIIIVGGGASSAAKSAKGAKGVRSVKAAKLAKFARMAKMVRVLRIARLLRWFSHDDGKPMMTIALDNLNLKAYKNEILSLLGQNGAGKTTFFSMLMGLNEPTSGQCMVDGQNILISREIVRENVGSCPQHDVLFDYYSVEEHLRLYATMKGIAEEDLDLAVMATLEHVGLSEKAEAFVNHLSGGMRRRTSIAIACLGNPSIVLLDEPSAGVDIVNRQIVWKSLVALKKNRTIIMSTHFMEEAEILGDRVAVLKKGKLQVIGTCTELHNQFGAGYTLVINRPMNGDLLSVENAKIELDHAKKRFVKKAGDVMDEEEATKIADDVAKNWKKHLPPPEKPIMKRNIAKAAEEVENAKVREENSILCNPAKILEFVKTFIPEAELLDYTDEQAFLEYILPFEARAKFGIMFEKIDQSKASFGFEQFGLQAPTLQEVFLEISDLDAMDEDVQTAVQQKGRRRSSVVKSKENVEKKNRRRSSMTDAIRGAIDVEVVEEDRKSSSILAKKKKFSNAIARKENFQNTQDDLMSSSQLHHEADLHPETDHGQFAMHNEDIEKHKKKGKHEGTIDAHTTKDFKHRRTSLVGKTMNMLSRKGANVEDGEKKKAPKRQTMSSSQKYRKQKVIEWSPAQPSQHWRRQVRAMVVKRYITSKRNRKAMLLQGVLPIFMVLMGVLFTSINHEIPSGYYESTSLELDSYSDGNLELWADDKSGDKSPLTRHASSILEDSSIGFKNTTSLASDLSDTSEIDVGLPHAFLLGQESYAQDTSFASRRMMGGDNPFNPLNPNLGMLQTSFSPCISSGSPCTSDIGTSVTTLHYNGTNVRSAAGITNLISESYMREGYRLGLKAGSDVGASIKVSYKGLPMTDKEIDEASQPPSIALVAAILIFMSFASITASQCTDAVSERESGCKRQQLISGINPVMYWVANFVFDYAFYICVPFAATVGIIEAFQVRPFCQELNQFVVMLVYWGLASTSFAYVGSFIFARAAAAQQMMMTLNTVVALLLMATVLVLEMVNFPQVATPLRFCAMLMPNCCLGFSMWTFINDKRLDKESNSISDDGMLPCYVMLAEGIIYFVLAIAMENTQDKAAKGYAKSKIGTMDEVKAGSCQPDGETAKYLRKLTESSKFKAFIFGMIIFNMVVIAIDMAEEDSEDLMFILVIAAFNYVFTFIFFMEMVLKLGGFGPIVYCQDPFNIFDGLLVLLSLVEIFLAGNSTFTAAKSGKVVGKSGRMLKLVRVFKFARLLRVLRYARFMGVAAQFEVKATGHQMLELAKEEELRKSSSASEGGVVKETKATVVRRLSILGGEYVEGSAVDVERKRIVRRLSQRYSDDVRKKSKELLGEKYKETAMGIEEEEESPMLRNERGDAIAINNLVKVYERSGATPVTATNDIGFGVRQGEIFSLLGPNGAGKSTVLNMMTGSVAPTSGEVYVLDKNISTQFDLVKSRIGFCPQFDALVGHMNSYETLTMFGRIKGIPEEDLPPLVDSLIRCIGLEPHAQKMCMHYSGGNRRKLSVAIALMGNPDIVFLDEPSTGMDPASLTDVYSCVWMWTRGGKNRSIILTTHSMEEADSLSDRIGILVNGKLAVLGTGQQLKSSFGMNYTFESSLQAGDDLHDRVECLKDIIKDNVKGCQDDGSFDGRVRYELPQDEIKLSEFFNLLEARREELKIKDYTVSQTTLEQVFIHFAQHQH